MGAWGTDSFENDEACDWAGSFVESGDKARVAKTLRAAARAGKNYIESDVGSSAVAAAEVVARALGKFGKQDAYTAKLDGWIAANELAITPDLRRLAVEALEQVKAPSSELRELWEDAGPKSFEEWLGNIDALEARIGPLAPDATKRPWWRFW